MGNPHGSRVRVPHGYGYGYRCSVPVTRDIPVESESTELTNIKLRATVQFFINLKHYTNGIIIITFNLTHNLPSAMFGKRVKKLTAKAAQAVADGSHGLKRKVSSISNKAPSKKSKNVPSKSSETNSLNSSPPASTANSQPFRRQPTVHTEEEEESLHGNAIVVESDTESEKSKAGVDDSDAEASDDELGKSLIPVIVFMILISRCHIERLKKCWTSPVYAFFEPTPSIEYTNGRRAHVFKCIGKGCKQRIQRYLDKGDAKSTSNMAKHVKSCWGEAAYEAAQDAKTAVSAREGVVTSILQTGSITTAFE